MMAAAAQGTRRDPELWDRLVNSRFGGEHPVLTAEESTKAAKRLYRVAMGKRWTGPIQLTSGNRYTWVKSGVLFVNPDRHAFRTRGLREIIHNLAHYAHARLHPNDAPHSARQARLEGRLVSYALRNGFLDGKLAPKPKPEPEPSAAKPDKVRQRYDRMVKRRDKWREELDRAKRLLAKAETECRAYERRHGERLKNPPA